MSPRLIYFFFVSMFALSCSDSKIPDVEFQLEQLFLDNLSLDLTNPLPIDIPVNPRFELVFSEEIDAKTIKGNIQLLQDDTIVETATNITSNGKNIVIFPSSSLEHNTDYQLVINPSLKSTSGSLITPITIDMRTIQGELDIVNFLIDNKKITAFSRNINTSLNPIISLEFNHAVDADKLYDNLVLRGSSNVDFTINPTSVPQTIHAIPDKLSSWQQYTLTIKESNLGINNEHFEGIERSFYTTIDSSNKFPLISTDELLSKVQKSTFQYFWEFAHEQSGMARERNTSNDLVTSGGSGFGLMALIVGIENNFITRDEGLDRLEKIIDFLEIADRFHGVWPHWINGNSGKVIPFSEKDDGGDLVETAFLMQGLLTFRQYLDPVDNRENELIGRINVLWSSVEWDWYTQGGQNVLFWHWSPQFGWEKNLKIRGHNETLITYILAASAPIHSIEPIAYHEGYARSGNMVNGNNFYNIHLPLGADFGGPLFFTHYSFLGLDPRNLKDQYADYWEQNKNHTLINREWCIRNDKEYLGYSSECWGLTASDNHEGYSAHSPNNDKGVITPTAAISSLPYTPGESLDALNFFYYILGDKIWGAYGFKDAFNPTENWYANSYLAIDQGPIICMIENHKTGLLWDLFMSAPEISAGLDKLGFTY